MNRPRLLDLFCGAGGCAAGYAAAGFDVTGVDIRPQKNWPKYLPGIKECRTADALEFVDKYGRHYDVITASPPCQRYTHASFTPSNRERHQDLVAVTRGLLMAAGKPYVIENVMGAPLEGHCLMLCGLMFQLKVFRHRWFESNQLLLSPPHPSHNGHLIGKAGMCCVVGKGGGASARMRVSFRREAEGFKDSKADWMAAMDIDWMTMREMAQAIPPAYTTWIGKQLLHALEVKP